MTNLPGNKYSALDILKEYKEQAAVETRFRFLKDPTYVDGIYLKNPERVMALGYVFLMALLVFSLLERRVRNNLKAKNEKLRIPGKIKTDSPTGVMLLEMLSKLQMVIIFMEGQAIRTLPGNLFNSQVIKLLTMAGLDENIYIQPQK
jgi:transposase